MQTQLDLVSLVVWPTSRMEVQSLFRALQFSGHIITLPRPYDHRNILHGPISALGLINGYVAIARSAATTTMSLDDIRTR